MLLTHLCKLLNTSIELDEHVVLPSFLRANIPIRCAHLQDMKYKRSLLLLSRHVAENASKLLRADYVYMRVCVCVCLAV